MVRLKLVSPSEFWKLTPNEGALFIDEVMAQQPGQGGLDADVLARLDKKAARLRKQGVNVL